MRRKFYIRLPPYILLGLFLFTVGGILSSGFSRTPLISLVALIKYLYLIAVWFWLATVLLQRPEHIKTAVVLWASSAALSGLGALIQLVWGDVITATSPTHGRMTGFTEHVNDLGGLTSVVLIPAIVMVTNPQNTSWRKLYSSACVVLITAGLVLSVSISGVFALLLSFMVWFLSSRLKIKSIIVFSISVFVCFAAISIQARYTGVSILTRFNDISDDGFALSTLEARLDTYSAAWEVIRSNPFLGVGLGPDVGTTKTGHVVHNIFLLNWFESGLFGLFGILTIISTILLEAFRGLQNPTCAHIRNLGISLFSSYIAFVALGMAQPIYYKRYGWISAALLLALCSKNSRAGNRQESLAALGQHFDIHSKKLTKKM